MCTRFKKGVPKAGLLGIDSDDLLPDTGSIDSKDRRIKALVVYLRQGLLRAIDQLAILKHQISLADEDPAHDNQPVALRLLDIWSWHTHLDLGLEALSIALKWKVEFVIPTTRILDEASALVSQEHVSRWPELVEILGTYESMLVADADALEYSFTHGRPRRSKKSR